MENVGRELWREKWKGSGEGGGEVGRMAKEEGRKEGEGEEEGWEEVGRRRGRTRNQGRKEADTARPGGACRVGSLKKFWEVINTFQAAGRERRACRYFWKGVQLGWRPEAGPEARLGWAGPRGLGSICGDWPIRVLPRSKSQATPTWEPSRTASHSPWGVVCK